MNSRTDQRSINRVENRRLQWCAVALCACASVTWTANGQSATAGDTIPYAEYSFGFEMRLPAGWSYDRTRFAGPGGGLRLMQGRAPAERATLQVVIYRTLETPDFGRWVERFAAELTAASGAGESVSRLVKHSERKVGERKGIVLELERRSGEERTRQLYLAVAFDPTTIWVLVFGRTETQEVGAETIRRQFDTIGDSLKVLHDPVAEEQIAAALGRGKELLKNLKELGPRLEPDDQTYYYELVVDGKPVGYLTRRISRETRSLDDSRSGGNVKDGLRIRERNWRFAEDEAAVYGRVDLFASFDQQSEMIRIDQTQIPARGAPVQQALTTSDRCVREEEMLFSSYTTSLDRKYPEPREPLRVGASYLGLAWTRVLPQLLPPEAGEPRAFAVYDSETRALITHVIKPLGKRPLPADRGKDGQAAPAYEVREAFSAQPALLYTDEHGVVVRVDAGDTVLVRSSKDEIDRKYGRRCTEAQQRQKDQRAFGE